jgi:nucleotide-binding universal stress UspA family protein
MPVFAKIICPIDFSAPSYAALEYAAEMARRLSSELVLLHVAQPLMVLPDSSGLNFEAYETAIRDNAEKLLRDAMARPAMAGVNARSASRYGYAADEIVGFARSEKADVIVIASHGLTGWRRSVFGSVTDKVLHEADGPILVLPAREPAAA